MKNQKVLQSAQINWYEDDNARLNYQMIFNEQDSDDATNQKKNKEERIDNELRIHEVVTERDQKWKIKVQNTKEKAFSEGFEQGKKEGLEQARSEIDSKIAMLHSAIERGVDEWKKRQELVDPGLLDVAFDIAEAILGVPVENPEIRRSLELSLGPLLEQIEDQSKPVLLVAESDFEYIKQLKSDYAPNKFLSIRIDDACKPGEFTFESNDEKVIQHCKETLSDFRKKLPIPGWL